MFSPDHPRFAARGLRPPQSCTRGAVTGRFCWFGQRQGSAPGRARRSADRQSQHHRRGLPGGSSPFPRLPGLREGNERVAGRYAGREALLKSAVLPRKQVNRWKEGAVVKGDKSINEPIFIISLMMVLKPLDRKGKVGATRALVSGPRGRQERRGGVGRLPGKFVR